MTCYPGAQADLVVLERLEQADSVVQGPSDPVGLASPLSMSRSLRETRKVKRAENRLI